MFDITNIDFEKVQSKIKFPTGTKVIPAVSMGNICDYLDDGYPDRSISEAVRNFYTYGGVIEGVTALPTEKGDFLYSICFGPDYKYSYTLPEGFLKAGKETKKVPTQIAIQPWDRFLIRAKDFDTGEWIEGCYIRDISRENCCSDLSKFAHKIMPVTYTQAFAHPIDPKTLCQKTGFCVGDKEIWENDIVEVVWCSGRTERYLMWWCREMSMMSAILLEGIQFNGHDYWNSPHRTYDDFALMMQDPWGDIKSVEVVGNLFDNSELLHNKEEEKDER